MGYQTPSGVEAFSHAYFYRIFHWSQMDFDSALSSMVSLFHNPLRVALMARNRKYTKNRWARDDPAFVLITLTFIAVTLVAYALALSGMSVWTFSIKSYMRQLLWEVVFGFIGTTFTIATAITYIANRRMVTTPSVHTVRQELEWQYSFDLAVHCYFVYLIVCVVGQYILLPVLVSHSSLAAFVANTLWAAGLAAASSQIFFGLAALPFLDESRKAIALAPVALCAVGWVVATLGGINMTHEYLRWTFGVDLAIRA